MLAPLLGAPGMALSCRYQLPATFTVSLPAPSASADSVWVNPLVPLKDMAGGICVVSTSFEKESDIEISKTVPV
jgi:hypothetical protein